MDLKYYSLLFSVVGILILYGLSLLGQPIIATLEELPQYEGKQVVVQGIVVESHQTNYGGHLIVLKENNTTATIFVEGAPSFLIEYGDAIQVEGKVQKYGDVWEVVVDDEKQVTLLQKWQNISFPLWQLAEHPERYKGTNVNVTGLVDVMYGTYFYLVDEDGEHSLIVFCSSSHYKNIFPGEKVSVAATFFFDKSNFRYVLDVCKNSHGVTSFEGNDI